MSRRGTETEFELTTIERLERLNYGYAFGMELERPHEEVVLKDVLRAFLSARYDLPEAALSAAVERFLRPEGIDTLRRNMAFHKDLTRGIEVEVERDDGTTEHRHVYAVDWEDPDANRFMVVNQLPVKGRNDRRPDLVVFINGLPLVVFELKNPYDDKPTVEGAINQLGHYTVDIPQLFEFNALVVASDGVSTRHAMWTSGEEWYAPWRSIDGFNVEAATTGSMKTLIEGLFPKERLLAYIRHFVLFEVANERITKKGAKYYQFFAVRLAAERAVQAALSHGDKRVGVIWHTTGSGKSLSMVFLVGLLRRDPRLQNPSFVIEVDRNDLDELLRELFVASRALVGDVTQAEDPETLRALLRGEGGEVVLTTVQKFRLKQDGAGVQETRHPVLSERANIFVIADEAHRSQYGFEEGYARYLSDALPNARLLGFTGTPVNLSGANTEAVFGDILHTYDIRQAQEDRATVQIHYEGRQIPLTLKGEDLDAALSRIVAEHKAKHPDGKQLTRWAALAKLAGTEARVEVLAKDLLAHYRARTETLNGKAIAVCMTRENCVALYNALTALPGCPEVKVIMTGNLSEDPKAWSEGGHLTTKAQREAVKARMIDVDDPLKIVIVCDMWLTGTDIPCLHTLFVDKPMQGHTMIQAISRVNRVFKDKPNGVIVDYIGIADSLREATSAYAKGGGRGEPAPNLEAEAVPLFEEALAAVRALLPGGTDYGDWRGLSRIDLEDRYAGVFGRLTETEGVRDAFLQAAPPQQSVLAREAVGGLPRLCRRGGLLSAGPQTAPQDRSGTSSGPGGRGCCQGPRGRPP